MKDVVTGFIDGLKETRIVTNFLNLSSIQLSNALLLILIYPVITRIIGIENFGMVMLANTFSGLAAIIINYGTNQSGIRDVAIHIRQRPKLNKVVSNTLWIRLLIFLVFILFLFVLHWAEIRYLSFILLAVPIVLAEVLNPLFFFLGAERLRLYNIANLFSKVMIIVMVLFFIKGSGDSEWVNFIMGMSSTLTYASLLVFIVVKHQLSLRFPQWSELKKITTDNFFLTANNISVHLQQSLMIFAIAKWGNAAWLGAYSLCDKVIWSSRILIISASNAIYPKAAQLFQESVQAWNNYRDRVKKMMALLFSLLSLVLLLLPELVIRLMSGEDNQTAVHFLRVMAFAPALSALNALNVLDLLLKNDTLSIFRIALVLLLISTATAWLLVNTQWVQGFGIYTLIVDGSALMMYGYVIKKSARNYA